MKAPDILVDQELHGGGDYVGIDDDDDDDDDDDVHMQQAYINTRKESVSQSIKQSADQHFTRL